MCECKEDNCGDKNVCCESSCGSCNEGSYDKLDMFLCLAKEAKIELLKEKMKKRLEAADGRRLDRVADLFAEALLDHYRAEGDAAKKRQELSEKLEKIFEED